MSETSEAAGWQTKMPTEEPPTKKSKPAGNVTEESISYTVTSSPDDPVITAQVICPMNTHNPHNVGIPKDKLSGKA